MRHDPNEDEDEDEDEEDEDDDSDTTTRWTLGTSARVVGAGFGVDTSVFPPAKGRRCTLSRRG